MFNYLRPFIAPILVPFISATTIWLNVRFNIVYTPEMIEQINEGAVTAVLALFAAAASLAGAIKVAVNKRLNPANAATTQLAEQGKVQNAAAKMSE